MGNKRVMGLKAKFFFLAKLIFWATLLFLILQPLWPFYYKLAALTSQITLGALRYKVSVTAGKKWGVLPGNPEYIYFLYRFRSAQVDASFFSLNIIPFLALMFSTISKVGKAFLVQVVVGVAIIMTGHQVFLLSAFFYFCRGSMAGNILTTFFGDFGSIFLPFILWLLFRGREIKLFNN